MGERKNNASRRYEDGFRSEDARKGGLSEGERKKNASLVLKSLQWEVDEDFLRETFEEAISVKVLRRGDGKSCGIGFVDFRDQDTASRVMRKFQGRVLKGREVVIAYSLRQQSQFDARRDGSQSEKMRTFGSSDEMRKRAKNASLVLKSLQWLVGDDDLRKTFEEATSVKVLKRKDGKSSGVGFVDFKDEETATRVMREWQGKPLNGRPVVIAYSLQRRPQGGGSQWGAETSQSA